MTPKDYGSIRSLVDAEIAEGQSLDFKQMVDFKGNGLSKESSRDFCQTVTAFANSGGGTIVYGVKTIARDGLDIAHELTPLAEPARISALLQANAFSNISPNIEGLSIDTVTLSVSENTGFVVVSVPSSDDRPHMSTATDDHRFYKRNGHQNLRMSKVDVQDQMLRTRSPKIAAKIRISPSGSSGALHHFDFRFILVNISDVVAENAFLEILSLRQLHINHQDPSNQFGFSRTYSSKNNPIYLAENHVVLHPDTEISVTARQTNLMRTTGGMIFRQSLHSDEGQQPACIAGEFRFGCRGFRAQRASIKLEREYVDDLFDSRQSMELRFGI